MGWDIPLHFDTNPESLRPFVPEIWPNNVFNLSATYDLDLWPKILKIFVSHGVPIRNMYAKFHNDRLRNGWDITLWNFAKTRTNTQTNTQTHTQTTNRHGHYNTSPSPYGGEVIIISISDQINGIYNYLIYMYIVICKHSNGTECILSGLFCVRRPRNLRSRALVPSIILLDGTTLIRLNYHQQLVIMYCVMCKCFEHKSCFRFSSLDKPSRNNVASSMR